jgi:hypothetical protein
MAIDINRTAITDEQASALARWLKANDEVSGWLGGSPLGDSYVDPRAAKGSKTDGRKAYVALDHATADSVPELRGRSASDIRLFLVERGKAWILGMSRRGDERDADDAEAPAVTEEQAEALRTWLEANAKAPGWLDGYALGAAYVDARVRAGSVSDGRKAYVAVDHATADQVPQMRGRSAGQIREFLASRDAAPDAGPRPF